MVHLFINQKADQKYDHGIANGKQVVLNGRNAGCAAPHADDNGAKILDIDVNGIEQEKLFQLSKLCGIVKNGGQVQQER